MYLEMKGSIVHGVPAKSHSSHHSQLSHAASFSRLRQSSIKRELSTPTRCVEWPVSGHAPHRHKPPKAGKKWPQTYKKLLFYILLGSTRHKPQPQTTNLHEPAEGYEVELWASTLSNPSYADPRATSGPSKTLVCVYTYVHVHRTCVCISLCMYLYIRIYIYVHVYYTNIHMYTYTSR